jgi:hypothetical protein
LRKQIAVSLAETTQMNERSPEIRKQTGKMNEQIACLLAGNTQLRQQTAV